MTVKAAEQAVKELTPKQMKSFRTWFQRYEAACWDKELATDAAAGRLDALASKAVASAKKGQCRPLRA